MRTTRDSKSTVIDRIADSTDLAIDLMTLGQYGLERVPADDAGNEGCGHMEMADWEALRPARRRGACEWDWPERCREALPA